MAQRDLHRMGYRWPYHSAHFWSGLLAGLGVGLAVAAALVELEMLTSHRKAWVSLLGAVLVGIGGIVAWHRQPSSPGGVVPGTTEASDGKQS